MEKKVDESYLISIGFEVVEIKPLFTRYKHKRNELCFAVTGKYGELFVGEKHWCNDEYERVFDTTNPSITRKDFETIIRYLLIDNIII